MPFNNLRITTITPALNEEAAIGLVINNLQKLRHKGYPIVDEIIVCDNGSSDATISVSLAQGATVVQEQDKGYGRACLKAISALEKADVVVFIDGDNSDDPNDIVAMLDEIDKGYDLVLISRTQCLKARKSLLLQQQFGNWLATGLIRLFWRFNYSDLGPLRAIRFNKLQALGMQDKNYGWTVEMQIVAVLKKLKIKEINGSYKARIGQSKISGTIKGTVLAGCKIIYKIVQLKLLELRGVYAKY